MDSNIASVLSTAFRIIFIAVNCHGVMLIVLSIALDKKRSLKYIILYDAIKIVIVNTLMGSVMKDMYRDLYLSMTWLQIVYLAAVLTIVGMNFVMLLYTFRGEPLRIAMVSLAGDLASGFFGYFSIGIINSLEGRDFFLLAGEFQLMDLGIPVICYGLVGICSYFCRPVLKKLRLHEFKHKKLLWLVFVGFILSGTYTLLIADRKAVRSGMLIILILIGFWLPVLFIALKKYRERLEEEHVFLETQQRLMKQHYQNVLAEAQRMKHCSKATEEQMLVISSMQGEAGRRKWISDYKESLMQEYHKLKVGLYCDDWVLDAMLSSQAELLDSHGIRLECSLQEYRNQTISQQDLLQLLLALIYWGMRANENIEESQYKFIRLQMSSVKTQLMIQFESSWNEAEQISESMLKRYIKKYEGYVQIARKTGEVRVSVVL